MLPPSRALSQPPKAPSYTPAPFPRHPIGGPSTHPNHNQKTRCSGGRRDAPAAGAQPRYVETSPAHKCTGFSPPDGVGRPSSRQCERWGMQAYY